MKRPSKLIAPGTMTTGSVPSVAIEVLSADKNKIKLIGVVLEVGWLRPVRCEVKRRTYENFAVKSLERDIIELENS